MTETEAIAIVKKQFTGADGFVAQLRRGQGIDEAAVNLTKEALQTLKSAWADRQYVPKDAVLPLVDIMTAIRSSIDLQPELTNEILQIAMDMDIQVDEIFGRGNKQMSEEEAMAIVRSHLIGDSSFLLALHRFEGLDQSSASEVQLALEALQHAWADRQNVPKAIVGPMLGAPDAVLDGYSYYPLEMQQELDILSNNLRELIKRCLG